MIEIDPFDPGTKRLQEIADELQGKISLMTLTRAADSGELTTIRIGSNRFTSRDAVRAWSQACTANGRKRISHNPAPATPVRTEKERLRASEEAARMLESAGA